MSHPKSYRFGMQFAVAATAAGALALGAAAVPPDPPRYVLTDLGTLGGAFSEALAMNNNGVVVGWSTTTDEPTDNPRAFLWQDGAMRDLGTLGGIWTEARGVNDDNQVVGVSMVDTDARDGLFERHGFYWYDGVMFDLNDIVIGRPVEVPPNSFGTVETCSAPIRQIVEANQINNDGTIVGCGLLYGDDNMHGIVLVPEQPFFPTEPSYYWADLGLLEGATDCFAYAVNDFGIVVGMSGQQAFVHDGEMHPLEFHAGASAAESVNRYGTIVGWSGETEMQPVACMWQDGHRFDLGVDGDWTSRALAIGDNGLVVGWTAQDLGQPMQAMMWEGCIPVPLNQVTAIPLSERSRWEILERATAIDDAGRIAGVGRAEDGAPRAFILTPLGLEDPDATRVSIR